MRIGRSAAALLLGWSVACTGTTGEKTDSGDTDHSTVVQPPYGISTTDFADTDTDADADTDADTDTDHSATWDHSGHSSAR